MKQSYRIDRKDSVSEMRNFVNNLKCQQAYWVIINRIKEIQSYTFSSKECNLDTYAIEIGCHIMKLKWLRY